MVEPDERWQQFEADGEEAVRKKLGAKVYGDELEALAREWLDFKSGESISAHRARIEASNREHIKAARSAKNAAWAAAIVAIVALIISTVIAYLSWAPQGP